MLRTLTVTPEHHYRIVAARILDSLANPFQWLEVGSCFRLDGDAWQAKDVPPAQGRSHRAGIGSTIPAEILSEDLLCLAAPDDAADANQPAPEASGSATSPGPSAPRQTG